MKNAVGYLLTCAAIANALMVPAASAAETKVKSQVPLEKLITLNAVELFGTEKVTLKEDCIEIIIDGAGHMAGASKGRNIYDSQHKKMVGSNRGFFTKDDTVIPGFCVLGKGKSVWTSRFPLAGETNLQFNFRIPNLLGRASDIRLRINSKKRGGYETTFFNSIAKVKKGKPSGRVVSSLKKYRGVPTRWFPRSAEKGVRVEFGIDKDGAFTKLGNEEIVRLKAGRKFNDTGEEVVFSFKKILFTLQNLKISGLLDREWAASALAELEEKGKLLERPPAPKTTAPTPAPEGAEAGEAAKKSDSDDDVKL